MFNFLSSSFKKLRLKKKSTTYVAPEDLDLKHKKGVIQVATNPSYPYMKHGLAYTNKDEGVVRVKVLMTKEEATRLLLKCKNGGALNFKDVAKELKQIPMGRVSIVSTDISNKGDILESIAEES